jgi:hypothetical protein
MFSGTERLSNLRVCEAYLRKKPVVQRITLICSIILTTQMLIKIREIEL